MIMPQLNIWMAILLISLLWFSHCAGNCPFTLSQFIKIAAVLPDDTRLIFVSIDNERDNIDHLKTYLANIDPSIIGWRIADDSLQ